MICDNCGCGFRDGEKKCPICGKAIEVKKSDSSWTKNGPDPDRALVMDQNRDLQMMFQRFSQEAAKGKKHAMMYIADCFLYGWGTPVNFEQYRNCLMQAARLGDDRACERIFYEALVSRDEVGIENALSIWGHRPTTDSDRNWKYEKTIEIYQSLTDKSAQGMIESFANAKSPDDWKRTIAMCYQFGFGVERDPQKAVQILNDFLGSLYDFADSVATVIGLYDIGAIPFELIGNRCFEIADKLGVFDTLDSNEYPNKYVGYNERLIILAACRGNVKSQTQMAQLYLKKETGGYLPNNPYANDLEALRWLTGALENGADVEDALGLCFVSENVDNSGDHVNAFKGWYALAEHGFVPAQRIVGAYYYNGNGVAQDYDLAGQWWLRAAQNGEETAIQNVKSIQELGNGDFWAGINVLKMETRNQVEPAPSTGNNTEQKPTSGGCYIATCVYGSYDCPQVWTLRRYRDYCLSKTRRGRLFIKVYYALSPHIVRIFGKSHLIKKMWKRPLDRMVCRLQKKGYRSTQYKD